MGGWAGKGKLIHLVLVIIVDLLSQRKELVLVMLKGKYFTRAGATRFDVMTTTLKIYVYNYIR